MSLLLTPKDYTEIHKIRLSELLTAQSRHNIFAINFIEPPLIKQTEVISIAKDSIPIPRAIVDDYAAIHSELRKFGAACMWAQPKTKVS